MERTPSIPKAMLWGAPVVALLAVVAALVINWAESSRSQLPILAVLPEFRLTERSGEGFERNDLNGRLHVVSFMFTRCLGVCPRMNTNIRGLYDLYAASDKVHFLSLSVDPEYDSQEILQRYADSIGVRDERWKFVRGSIEDVRSLIETGFMLDASDLPAGHPARLVLVDQFGQIRGYYTYDDESDIALLKQNIRQLAREM